MKVGCVEVPNVFWVSIYSPVDAKVCERGYVVMGTMISLLD